MKKINVVQNKISNKLHSYTSKSAFEDIILSNKDMILSWFDELVPIQTQIEHLQNLGCSNLQKRNYTRILTKLFKKEYETFISINILVRDSDFIAQTMYNIKDDNKQYEYLTKNNKLKYPGKHKIYVPFEIYRDFIKTYKDELKSIVKEEDINKEQKKEKTTNWMDVLLKGI